MDHLAGSKLSRSAFIEGVLRIYFRKRANQKVDVRDLEHINAAASRLNVEAEDVLIYCASEVEDLPS